MIAECRIDWIMKMLLVGSRLKLTVLSAVKEEERGNGRER